MKIFPAIQAYLTGLQAEIEQIPSQRKVLLDTLASYVRAQQEAGEFADLIFICTHNSRRSHFGQIWAQCLATYHGFSHVNSFSGGTEATAFHPNSIRALQEAGFQIHTKASSANPVYLVEFGSAPSERTYAWSKTFSDPANPKTGFCAVMTCSEADEACPLVAGAKIRIPLTYEDPKVGDGSPQEAAGYRERCRQIAAELTYLYMQVRKKTD